MENHYCPKLLPDSNEMLFPIDVNCFKNADHKSFFLNELAKDIVVYKMWDI